MNRTVFIKVYTKDRLPPKSEKGVEFYMTEKGLLFEFDIPSCEWWLEEIQLPSDEEIDKAIAEKSDNAQTPFMRGIQFILNKLKL